MLKNGPRQRALGFKSDSLLRCWQQLELAVELKLVFTQVFSSVGCVCAPTRNEWTKTDSRLIPSLSRSARGSGGGTATCNPIWQPPMVRPLALHAVLAAALMGARCGSASGAPMPLRSPSPPNGHSPSRRPTPFYAPSPSPPGTSPHAPSPSPRQLSPSTTTLSPLLPSHRCWRRHPHTSPSSSPQECPTLALKPHLRPRGVPQ